MLEFILFQETEKARAVREMEERLISSAFYNLSMQMHRNAVETRLGQSAGSQGGQQGQGQGQGQNQGSSFLARQRAVNQNRPRGQGYSSSDFLEY